MARLSRLTDSVAVCSIDNRQGAPSTVSSRYCAASEGKNRPPRKLCEDARRRLIIDCLETTRIYMWFRGNRADGDGSQASRSSMGLATLLLIRVSLELSIVFLLSGREFPISHISYERILVMRQLLDYVQWRIGITGNFASNVTVRVC